MDSESQYRHIKEEIRQHYNIVDVVGRYVRLTRAGKDWKGLCPFHSDRKPSFTVNPQFQSYRCWSCGEKGDLFTFIQKKENLDFIEAMEFLARDAGTRIERESG